YVVAIPGCILAMAQLYLDLTRPPEDAKGEDANMDEVFDTGLERRTEVVRTLVFTGWLAGSALAIWLLGIVYGLPLFVILYCLIQGREKLWVSFLLSAGTYILLWGLFEFLLGQVWPEGILFQ
ncbi:MAG: tripartite tricarboxylate transporter TctB family protein, partial [Pseudomonadota bacterium]